MSRKSEDNPFRANKSGKQSKNGNFQKTSDTKIPRQLKDNILRMKNKALTAAENEYQRGNYKDALTAINQIELKSDHTQDDETWCRLLHVKSRVLYYLGKFNEALESYRLILKCRKKILAENPMNINCQIEVAEALDSMLPLLSKMGLYDEVMLNSEESLIIYTNLYSKNPYDDYVFLKIGETHVDLGVALSYKKMFEKAKDNFESAHIIFGILIQKYSNSSNIKSSIQSIDATCLNNLGNVLKNQGHIKEAKEKYEEALHIKENLVEVNPHIIEIQLNLIGFLINLGNVLTDLELLKEAEIKYKKAFLINEKLLKADPNNSHYKSFAGDIFSNLGTLYFKMGKIKEANLKYTQSLEIFNESLQYTDLKIKSRTIILLIKLNLSCAEVEKDLLDKLTYLKEAYTTCKVYKPFFETYRLSHEKSLAMKAGLRAFVEYSMLILKEKGDSNKLIFRYSRSIQAIETMGEIESDEQIRELLSSSICYLKGRKLINESLKSEGIDIELIEQAKEQFRGARNSYDKANLCYCIYTGLLKLEYIEDLRDIEPIVSLIHEVIREIYTRADSSVISAFEKIIDLLENKEYLLVDKSKGEGRDEFLKKLNDEVLKIDYYALRQIFGHTSEKLAEYLKEPFSVNVEYAKWKLRIKISDPENIKGVLTINAGNELLFSGLLDNRTEIIIPYRPRYKRENIIFETSEQGKKIVRQVDFNELIEDEIDAYILEHDCSLSTISNTINTVLNIAIVQLRYEIIIEDRVVKLVTEKNSELADNARTQAIQKQKETYKKKIRLILENLKDKAKIVVFPEFSIPFEYLAEIKRWADSNQMIIVAGSHYVTEDHLKEYNGLFALEVDDKDLRKNICPIIIPKSKIIHIEKMFAAKLERELLNEEGMTPGNLNYILKVNENLTIGILICFEYLNNSLKERLIEVCDVILVPQTNPGPSRFIDTAIDDIDNPQYSGNKTYIMANGIFPFEGRVSGGSSCVISTLDKHSNRKQIEEIESIKEVYEQFVLFASIDIGVNLTRVAANAKVPIKIQYIPIIEEDEVYYKAEFDLKEDIEAIKRIYDNLEEQKNLIIKKEENTKNNIQTLINLFNKVKVQDGENLKKLLETNRNLIEKYSPLMYQKNIKNIKNLKFNEIKNKSCIIFVPRE